MQMNRVVIAGYVAKKPEERHLPSGTPATNVRVCESVRYTDGGGETRELMNWPSLSFYGKLADVGQALKKGDNVYVDGRIEQRQLIARDGGSPTRDESRGHGRRKKRCQWTGEYGRRG